MMQLARTAPFIQRSAPVASFSIYTKVLHQAQDARVHDDKTLEKLRSDLYQHKQAHRRTHQLLDRMTTQTEFGAEWHKLQEEFESTVAFMHKLSEDIFAVTKHPFFDPRDHPVKPQSKSEKFVSMFKNTKAMVQQLSEVPFVLKSIADAFAVKAPSRPPPRLTPLELAAKDLLHAHKAYKRRVDEQQKLEAALDWSLKARARISPKMRDYEFIKSARDNFIDMTIRRSLPQAKTATKHAKLVMDELLVIYNREKQKAEQQPKPLAAPKKPDAAPAPAAAPSS